MFDKYILVHLADTDTGNDLGYIYLNKNHSIEDFQNAIYKAKVKREEDIMKYGDDWKIIKEELDEFDFFEPADSTQYRVYY